jgi:hypothetical protein
LRNQAMVLAAEAKEMGAAVTAPAGSSAANDPAAADAEYAELTKTSAERRLSESERGRMLALKTASLEREPAIPSGTPQEQAAHRKALGLPVKPSEYDALVAKSVTGLSADEHNRMVQLAGQRLVSEGKATAEDVAVEEQSND